MVGCMFWTRKLLGEHVGSLLTPSFFSASLQCDGVWASILVAWAEVAKKLLRLMLEQHPAACSWVVVLQLTSPVRWWGSLLLALWPATAAVTMWGHLQRGDLDHISWCRMVPRAAAMLAVALLIPGRWVRWHCWECGCWGRVGSQLTPFPPVFEHRPIPQWKCRCVSPPIPACNPPARCQDPSWRRVTQSLKLNYDSPCFWKPFESFLCHGHLVFTSQFL